MIFLDVLSTIRIDGAEEMSIYDSEIDGNATFPLVCSFVSPVGGGEILPLLLYQWINSFRLVQFQVPKIIINDSSFTLLCPNKSFNWRWLTNPILTHRIPQHKGTKGSDLPRLPTVGQSGLLRAFSSRIKSAWLGKNVIGIRFFHWEILLSFDRKRYLPPPVVGLTTTDVSFLSWCQKAPSNSVSELWGGSVSRYMCT